MTVLVEKIEGPGSIEQTTIKQKKKKRQEKPLPKVVGPFPVESKSPKITIAVLFENLPTDIPPEGAPFKGIELVLETQDLKLRTTLNGKSYRKIMKNGKPDDTAIIQGRLGASHTIVDAGISLSPKKVATESPKKQASPIDPNPA